MWVPRKFASIQQMVSGKYIPGKGSPFRVGGNTRAKTITTFENWPIRSVDVAIRIG